MKWIPYLTISIHNISVLLLMLLLFMRKNKKEVPAELPDLRIPKETIGATDLEGFGEKDMTQYDLNLLRVTPDGVLLNGQYNN